MGRRSLEDERCRFGKAIVASNGVILTSEGKYDLVMKSILAIVDHGNNAEVRLNKDGELDVFEVKKHKIT